MINKNNIFLLKEIVDKTYPNEDMPPASIPEIVIRMKHLLSKICDADFIEMLIGCFIPDLYDGMGKKKNYTLNYLNFL